MTTPAMSPPPTYLPPPSRMAAHVVAGVGGAALAAATLWAGSSPEQTVWMRAAVVLFAVVWSGLGYFSSLAYWVPGILLVLTGTAALWQIALPAPWLPNAPAPTFLMAAICLGLGIALHSARRAGRTHVRRELAIPAPKRRHAPAARMPVHIAAAIAALVTVLAAAWILHMLDHSPWAILPVAVLVGSAAALGAFSALAPLSAALTGLFLVPLLHIWLSDSPYTLPLDGLPWALATVLATGALACRYARAAGGRFERSAGASHTTR